MNNKSNIALIILILAAIIFIYNYSPTLTPTSKDSDLSDEFSEIMKGADLNTKKIDSCFALIDTTLQLPTIGCANFFYSLIDDKTLMAIEFPADKTFTGCSELIIEPSYSYNIELLIFDDGMAHLQNRCTCLINLEAPKPIEIYQIVTAKTIIGGFIPQDTFWNNIPFKTMMLEKALFRTETGKEKQIQRFLFWNVYDVGPAG